MGPAVASAFDEMTGRGGGVRPVYVELSRWLADVPPGVLDHRRREAELVFRRIGITFAAVVHAVFPFAFITTASRTLDELNERRARGARRAPVAER